MLFGHTMAGCDTTSAIFNFGKTTIFSKLEKSRELRVIVQKFYSDNVTPEEIGGCTEDSFRNMFSTVKGQTPAGIQWFHPGNRKAIEPAFLPPTARSVHFHGQEVYHQVQLWQKLRGRDDDSTEWRWKRDKN